MLSRIIILLFLTVVVVVIGGYRILAEGESRGWDPCSYSHYDPLCKEMLGN